MGKEILSIPEERLQEVIYVIRAGLEYIQAMSTEDISYETIEALRKWCNEYEEE